MNTYNRKTTRMLMGQRIRLVREKAGLSRRYLSQKLEISINTLERMENGLAPVEICDYINIYNICKGNPYHDFFMFLNPEFAERVDEILQGIKIPDADPDYHIKWTYAYDITCKMANTCTLDELVTINYILSCDYGGDRYAVLQTLSAYVQNPLSDRDSDCGLIVDHYENAKAKGNLPENGLPVNIKYIMRARERAKKAHREGEDKYI